MLLDLQKKKKDLHSHKQLGNQENPKRGETAGGQSVNIQVPSNSQQLEEGGQHTQDSKGLLVLQQSTRRTQDNEGGSHITKRTCNNNNDIIITQNNLTNPDNTTLKDELR